MPERFFPNTHIAEYDCFRSTKNAVRKHMEQGKIIMAINQLIAACGMLNFTDSTVVRRFTEHLQHSRFRVKMLQNIETGAMLSPAEYKEAYYQKLKEEAEQQRRMEEAEKLKQAKEAATNTPEVTV